MSVLSRQDGLSLSAPCAVGTVSRRRQGSGYGTTTHSIFIIPGQLVLSVDSFHPSVSLSVRDILLSVSNAVGRNDLG